MSQVLLRSGCGHGLAAQPTRAAGIASHLSRRVAQGDTLEDFEHPSAKQRLEHIDPAPVCDEAIAPIAGVAGQCVLGISATDYLRLLDWTGRQMHPNKRGARIGAAPRALQRLRHDPAQWPCQVLAVGSEFDRAVGAVECLMAKAAAMGQRWLHCIGTGRRLLHASRRASPQADQSGLHPTRASRWHRVRRAAPRHHDRRSETAIHRT